FIAAVKVDPMLPGPGKMSFQVVAECCRYWIMFECESTRPVSTETGGAAKDFGVFTNRVYGYQRTHTASNYKRMLPVGVNGIFFIDVGPEFCYQKF
ncbi:MAG TPA: hypothetical protein VKA08_01865, partial [Balneolales bacterium]|nr:hypothetical protein [Balneolales bacterium]